MRKPIWDPEDGSFLTRLSDRLAMDSDGNLLMRMSNNTALDLDSGELHITSDWGDDNKDDD